MVIDYIRQSNDPNNPWVQFIVKTPEKIPSVNDRLGINTKTKVQYLLPHVVQFMNEIKDQLVKLFYDRPKWITPNIYYNLTMQFILKHSYNARDLDNMNKSVIDCIAPAFGFNDSHVIEIHETKRFLPNSDYEYIIVTLSPSKIDPIYKL